ncbi:hypothetical protein [Kutzneria sp. 744]|uniref:hypothetical protein n=1 Tax=Kutzneria sp. (strain 744) TaxID=345341 RepID=UPI0003EECB9B|nr:hypothetical protein [Kutzneria sp. 744]EWM19262.1 hypothetical protein KUTG_09566 [Kutzneria sp. 744]
MHAADLATARHLLRPRRVVVTHLAEAETLIDHLMLPGAGVNLYKEPDEPNVVTWGVPGEPAGWSNQSQCASFITAVLRRAHPSWARSRYFARHFDSISPFARDYQRVFAAGGTRRFRPVARVADLRPGDLIAIDYANAQETNTGHVVMVRRMHGVYVAPNPRLNFEGEIQYAVQVADCTAEPHGLAGVGNYEDFPDTRIVGEQQSQGVGYGHMMFYASELTGEFTRYRWSVNSGSAGVFGVEERPVSAARVIAG